MPIAAPTLDELVNNGWQAVSQACGITNDSESGFAMSIVRVMAQYVFDLYTVLQEADEAGNLSTAVGSDLDTIGLSFGVSRLRAQVATSLGGPPSVLFTNNGLTSQGIPIGTRLWSPGNVDQAFFTTEAVVVPAGGQSYVDVTAARPGAFYNAGANTLTLSNLGNGNVTVTNLIPISSGSDVETDENYRARIAANIARREGPNATAIRQACLEIPGVRDVSILPYARGTGTFDVLVLGWQPVVTDSVVAQVQSVLDANVAVGISAIAKAPRTRSVLIDLYLTIKPGGDSAGAAAAAAQTIHGYIDNLPIEDGSGNGTLAYQALSARVQESHPDIVTSLLSLTVDGKPALRSNQIAQPGDRFVIASIVNH